MPAVFGTLSFITIRKLGIEALLIRLVGAGSAADMVAEDEKIPASWETRNGVFKGATCAEL